jgi:hypothetical protein
MASVAGGRRRPARCPSCWPVCDGPTRAGSAVPAAGDDGWDGYLAAFHGARPGVTEDVLARASAHDGRDPYDWLAQALPPGGVIVDVAGGSGPLDHRVGSGWVGLDRSHAELGRAAPIAPGRLVLADATWLPLGAGVADAVVCPMALMLSTIHARPLPRAPARCGARWPPRCHGPGDWAADAAGPGPLTPLAWRRSGARLPSGSGDPAATIYLPWVLCLQAQQFPARRGGTVLIQHPARMGPHGARAGRRAVGGWSRAGTTRRRRPPPRAAGRTPSPSAPDGFPAGR